MSNSKNLVATEGPWSSGLLDCFSNFPTCCLTCCCPCITFGRVSEIADRGESSCCLNAAFYTLINCLTGLGCLYSCIFRSKLRAEHRLQESPCGDCCVHFCCETCALCQEGRELKSKGFDLSIGWKGNLARNQGVAMGAPACYTRRDDALRLKTKTSYRCFLLF